jgi:hypothetical protein
MSLIWAFIPDEALILLVAAIGIALIAGIVRGRQAMSWLTGLVALILITPFVGILLDALPLWLQLLLIVAICFSLFRAFVSLFLGGHAADHMIGSLAANVVRFCFLAVIQLFVLPFRVIGWLMTKGY